MDLQALEWNILEPRMSPSSQAKSKGSFPHLLYSFILYPPLSLQQSKHSLSPQTLVYSPIRGGLIPMLTTVCATESSGLWGGCEKACEELWRKLSAAIPSRWIPHQEAWSISSSSLCPESVRRGWDYYPRFLDYSWCRLLTRLQGKLEKSEDRK